MRPLTMTMTIQARLFRHCHHYSTTLLVPAHRQHGTVTIIPQYNQLVSFIGSKRATFSSTSSSSCGGGGVGDGDGIVAGQRNRLRRSVHFVPADNTKFLTKALSLGADTIVFDLEDSVKDKHVGRERLRQYLESIHHQQQQQQQQHTSHRTTEMLIRINPLSSEIVDWKEDLEIGFMGCGVDGFMIPKVESHEELVLLDEVLTKLEKEHSVGRILVPPPPKVVLPIATETPMAVLNIASIAKGPRVCAITWGCEDLSAELGSYGTRHARNGLVGGGEYLDIFRYCRSMCLLAAKAANVQAIDGIYQNVRDITGLGKEASDAKYMGFDGKLTLHPDQISVVHSAFEPTQEEYEEANHIVSLWEHGGGSENDDGRNTRKGSLEYNGKMIDLPHYVRAKKVVARRSTVREPPIRHETTMGAPTTKNATQTSTTNGEGSQSNVTTPVDRGDDVVVDHDVFPRMNNGKYFEDLHPGMTIRHFLTRTVTEADNVFFTCLTLNPAPIHLDHELSKENTTSLSSDPSNKSSSDGTGKPLFNSMFTLGLLVGMSVPETTHGTTVANLGFSEVVFPKPVYPGDTLRAETTIVERRESKSRPTQGIVTFQHRAYNQRGEVVCKATRQALMKKRP